MKKLIPLLLLAACSSTPAPPAPAPPLQAHNGLYEVMVVETSPVGKYANCEGLGGNVRANVVVSPAVDIVIDDVPNTDSNYLDYKAEWSVIGGVRYVSGLWSFETPVGPAFIGLLLANEGERAFGLVDIVIFDGTTTVVVCAEMGKLEGTFTAK